MGTNVDNAGGAGVYSGANAAPAFGYVITQKNSGRYDESPVSVGGYQPTAEAWKAATVSKVAWLAYHQQNHSAVYTWLQTLSEADRTKLWEQCKFLAAAAGHFATL